MTSMSREAVTRVSLLPAVEDLRKGLHSILKGLRRIPPGIGNIHVKDKERDIQVGK